MSISLKRTILFWASLLGTVIGFSVAQSAQAYIGPGAGLTVIGTVLALFAAVVLAVVGFVWYPAKRILTRLRQTRSGAEKSSLASDNKTDDC